MINTKIYIIISLIITIIWSRQYFNGWWLGALYFTLVFVKEILMIYLIFRKKMLRFTMYTVIIQRLLVIFLLLSCAWSIDNGARIGVISVIVILAFVAYELFQSFSMKVIQVYYNRYCTGILDRKILVTSMAITIISPVFQRETLYSPFWYLCASTSGFFLLAPFTKSDTSFFGKRISGDFLRKLLVYIFNAAMIIIGVYAWIIL